MADMQRDADLEALVADVRARRRRVKGRHVSDEHSVVVQPERGGTSRAELQLGAVDVDLRRRASGARA